MKDHQRLYPILLIISALAAAALLIAPRRYTVQGASMLPGYTPGAKITVFRIVYGLPLPFSSRFIVRWNKPRTGEIVVFENPVDGKLTMKRCAGIEGDTLAISGAHIHIAGYTVAVTPAQASYFKRHPTVPEGYIFVAGDNSGASLDSRHFGYIPVSSVIGRVYGGIHA